MTALLSIFFLAFSYMALGFLCVHLAMQQRGKFVKLARLVMRAEFKNHSDDEIIDLWRSVETKVQNDHVHALKCSVAWPTWFMLVLSAKDKWEKKAEEVAAAAAAKDGGKGLSSSKSSKSSAKASEPAKAAKPTKSGS